MNRNILKQLTLKNFKGARSLTVDFGEKETNIAGANATFKTTLFDAFVWLLFGKDSTDRADTNFNIKTLDENGNPILKLEHEVCGILSLSGKDYELRRVYLEKWTVSRKSSEEYLEKHYTDFYINGVKQATKRDYDEFISSIISEDVFKMITNPFTFNSLSAQSQKNMLLDMAGGVTDDEVASLKPEFADFLKKLNGTDVAIFKKEVAAKKKKIEDELALLPARIDTAKSLKPEPADWKKIEDEIKTSGDEINAIDAQIADKSKVVEEQYKQKLSIRNEIGEKRVQINVIEQEIRLELRSRNNDLNADILKYQNGIKITQSAIESNKRRIQNINEDVQLINEELDRLRAEYRAINEDQIKYPEGAFVCPTCLRPLEMDDIETKQVEMQSNFNQDKSRRLKENQTAGKSKVERRNELETLKASLNSQIIQQEKDIEATTALIIKTQQALSPVTDEDIQKAIEKDERRDGLIAEISELEIKLNSISELPENSTDDLKERKTELQSTVDALKKRLADRDAIERSDALIKKYEDEKRTGNAAVSELKGMEYLADKFQKAKDDELMKKINGMFTLCTFSFIDEQLNGGERITCNCLVDGTPFPDLNNAMKVNAGIDIINAICRSKGVTAPIFIDNRESVSKLIPTESQIINLYVSREHEQLTVVGSDFISNRQSQLSLFNNQK